MFAIKKLESIGRYKRKEKQSISINTPLISNHWQHYYYFFLLFKLLLTCFTAFPQILLA